jgi:uncharacterized RDD family membrane protein YckC
VARSTVGDLPRAALIYRLAAMVYDALLVVALWMVTLFVLVAVSNDAVYGAVVRTILFLELYGFCVYFWISRGQTLGMLAWRLALRTDDGAPLSLTQATLRFLGALLSAGCFGFGYLWILIDPQRRSWGDLLSASHVVRLPKMPG